MAQKQKLRPSPLDEPPTASSSDSEEEDQPHPSSHQHEEEEVSSEEEEEASSQEDDEDDDLPPPLKNPPPPPTTTNPQPSSSDSETESGSETESEPDPTPSKVKPLASKPMDPPQKPKAQPSPAPLKSISKRPLENNAHPVTDSNPKRAKKKVTDSSSSAAAAAASDEEMEEDGKKSGDHLKKFQRLWSEEDEIAILKGMIEFISKTGQDPFKFTNPTGFHDFMKKSLRADCSSNQLKEKVRRLKKKFETNAAKVKNGDAPSFAKLHDQRSFELAKKVWGGEQGGSANGPVEKPKANGNAAKSPKKKETSSRNVTPAKKLKLETKSELVPAPVASLELKESGRMEIDQKPDSGVGSNLLWRQMFRYKEGVSGYDLNEDDVKRGLELIGESKRAELEEKWKKLQLAEMELFANRSLLIGEQAKLIAEVLQLPGH